MKKTFLLTLTFFLFLTTFSQNPKNAKSLNSMPIIEKGVEYHDNGEYEKAVQQFKKIPLGDSLYALAQYEMALTYYYQELYDKTIVTLEYLVDNPSPFVRSSTIYTLLGTVYLNNNQEEKAISILDKAIFLSPYSYKLHITQGDAYKKLKQYEKAENCYNQAIFCAPASQSAHRKLGQIYIKQNRIIPAIMAFNYAVFLEPKSDYAIEILQELNDFILGLSETVENEEIKNNISEKIKLEEERFNDLEILVSSNIALGKKFENKSKIKHIISLQSQLVFENLPAPTSSKEIIDYVYIPFFKGIMENDYFNLYSYHIFSGTNLDNNEVEKKAKKMEKKISKVIDFGFTMLKEQIRWGIGIENNSTPKSEFEYDYDSGNLEAIGGYSKKSGSGKILYSGHWIILDDNGGIKSNVNVKNGKKDGVCIYYNNGYKSQYIPFQLDSISGTAYVLFPTEVNEPEKISIEVPFVDNKINGIRKEFNRAGVMIEEGEYKDDLYNGVVKRYTEHGLLFSNGTYVNGEDTGLYQEFYADGKISFEVFYGKEDEEGYLKSYYPDGKIKKESSVLNNNVNGTMKSYYPNGQIMSVGSYNEVGNQDGFWTDYFENGNVSIEYSYENGKLNGEMKYYSRSGFLYGCEVYKNGILTEIKTYLPNKEIRETIKAKNKEFTVSFYNEMGQIMLTNQLNEKGEKEGISTYYYPCGAINSTITYKENQLHGPKIVYYKNGKIQEYSNYNDGEFDGLYMEYYENDTIKSEGYFQNGLRVGGWFSYNIVGELINHFIYDDNKLTYTVTYFPNGFKETETFYKYGLLTKKITYNNKNEVLKVDTFNEGSGILRDYYLNGNVKNEGVIKSNDVVDSLYFYDFTGKKTHVHTYLNGYAHGTLELHSNLSNEKTVLTYVHDEIHGPSYNYDDNGELINTSHYEYGVLAGEMKSNFENGKLSRIHTYENNFREDVSQYYAIDGKTLTYKLKYQGDEIIAYSFANKNNKFSEFIPITKEKQDIVAYYPNGQKAIEFSLINGERNEKEILYYPNGKKYRESNFVLNQYQGEYTLYYSSGTIKEKSNYYYDQIHGNYFEYYENGTPKLEGNYYYDLPHGIFKYYDKNGTITKEIEFYYGSIINQK